MAVPNKFMNTVWTQLLTLLFNRDSWLAQQRRKSRHAKLKIVAGVLGILVILGGIGAIIALHYYYHVF